MIISELLLQVRIIRCSLVASAVLKPVVDANGDPEIDMASQPQFRVVPLSYRFHTPCPWGKMRPDQGCMNCVHHQQQVVLSRPATEAEMDTMVDNEPEKWGLPPKSQPPSPPSAPDRFPGDHCSPEFFDRCVEERHDITNGQASEAIA